MVLLLASCQPISVLVISDPHVQALHEDRWLPGTAVFAMRARLHGFSVQTAETSLDRALPAVFEELDPNAAILIVSPFNAASLKNMNRRPERIIVAGGFPPNDGGEGVESVGPDRTEAMMRLGLMAREISDEMDSGGVYALVKTNTERRAKEMSAFIDAYNGGDAGERMPLEVVEIDRNPDSMLPDDFGEKASGAALLVFLAGAGNLPALRSSDEAALPVITESLSGSRAWSQRVVASVEDDQRAMARALLEQMRDDASLRERTYAARLKPGKWKPAP